MTTEQECLAVLAQELGPAARAFLNRQCRTHLKKEPSKLEKEDLSELAKWCGIEVQGILGAQAADAVKRNLLALR